MIVTSDNFGGFRYNGDLCDPHAESLAGRVGYYIDTTVARKIEKYINGQDKAYRSSAKTSPSFTFYSDAGHFRVLPIDVWSNADNEADAIADLNHFRAAIDNEGMKWADTAASLAGRVCREYSDTKQLEPRWREMAHNAIHQGPMVCAMGGAAHVIAWDR